MSTLTLNLPSHGIGAAQLAVIVANGDPVSEAIAASYQTKRGIPAANMIRVTLPTTAAEISSTDFATLKAAIDAQLPAGVQATLLTWSAPSRVKGSSCSMSITSAMAFGYKASYCNAACATTTSSAYFNSESQAPQTDLGMRPSMMLARTTLDAANALIDKGVSADGTAPAGTGWLIRTSDANRSGRYTDFSPLPTLWASTLALNYVDNSGGLGSDVISGKTDVLFYFTGLPSIPSLTTNQYRPGAIGDSLTSYAGVLPNGNAGQTLVTAWLDAGLTASYGTVEEPCNYTDKFPEASVLIDQYWRGATLIEAYWKSVATPGQGLFVGEPLAQPWRDAPTLTISGNNYLISSRALRPGSRYTLDYRTTTTGNWTTLASFNTASRAQLQSLTAPRPPATAVQLRWTGPCPTNASQSCTLASSS
ncbi:TIGR03790 family protein [Pelomonas sp. KK5]|uniref:TIGR03790 family protein n=1 Tax=Pelomonas sp. KK5 TaxID=1855730 RepID=UPI00097BF5DF|nr:TIGR03790 family protein [Pelomonas sp. KK5]